MWSDVACVFTGAASLCLFEQGSACFSWIHPKPSKAAHLSGIYAERICRKTIWKRCFTALTPHFVCTDAAVFGLTPTVVCLATTTTTAAAAAGVPLSHQLTWKVWNCNVFTNKNQKYRIHSNQIIFHLQAIIIQANAELFLFTQLTANVCVCVAELFFDVTAS